MTAPVVSVTVPWTVPEFDCAKSGQLAVDTATRTSAGTTLVYRVLKCIDASEWLKS
jgi:hypothetical protein